MNRKEAIAYAVQLMTKHGLYGWTFRLNTNKRRLGICKWEERRIELSVHHVDKHCNVEIIDTMLHEIAHALTPKHMHDDVWRRKAIEIGCNGNRCGAAMGVECRFRGVCPKCKRVIKRHRRKRNLYHIICGKTLGLYRWFDNSLNIESAL